MPISGVIDMGVNSNIIVTHDHVTSLDKSNKNC